MKHLHLILSAVLILLSAGSVSAQENIPPKMREKVKQLMVWKLTDRLDLTEEQSPKFFPILNKFLDDNEKLMDERRELLKDLQNSAGLNDSQLNEKSNRILKIDKERAENISKLSADSEKILTARQRAELIVFQTEFVRELAKMIEKQKGNRRSKDKD